MKIGYQLVQYIRESEANLCTGQVDNQFSLSAYNVSNYPQFKDVNTQMVEQSNSVLKRAKSSLSYMNKELVM